MSVKVNITKTISVMLDKYGNQIPKEEWLAQQDAKMGFNVGGVRTTNSVPKTSQETKSNKKE